jgi:hypothetical protein
MNNTTKIGMELGSKHLAKILSKGQRWQKRNIPLWIRTKLLIPYYITSIEGKETLYVIQYPVAPGEKVHFYRFAQHETGAEISDYTQQVC